MGFFLEAFTNKKFEIQRSTVKNEKDERYDAPYGFLMEVKDQELYPKEHPYSWSTIGFVDDLDRADSNDLKNFFCVGILQTMLVSSLAVTLTRAKL